MSTVDDVAEESLGVIEPPTLVPDPGEALFDDRDPTGFGSVEHLAYLGQAHPHLLTGPQHPHPLQVVRGVVAMAGGGAVRDHDTDLVPVPQHVHGDAELSGGFSDPHQPSISC